MYRESLINIFIVNTTKLSKYSRERDKCMFIFFFVKSLQQLHGTTIVEIVESRERKFISLDLMIHK